LPLAAFRVSVLAPQQAPIRHSLRQTRKASMSRSNSFEMNTSFFRIRILIFSLATCVALSTLSPAFGRADVVLTPGTESRAGDVTDAWLVARGLIGHGMISEQSSGNETMTPPPGVEVNETQQTANLTGEVLNRVVSWNESIDDDTIHIEVTRLSPSQFEVAFWLFPNHRQGCTMYQWTLYDHGRALQSAFWRNDAAVLRLAGAADLPPELYPDSVPWVAFLRVLGGPREGAVGMLDQQITPYSYVGQEVSAAGIEQISVPAGTFSALKVIAQVDIATIMPNWPRFVLHVIKPVIPKNTLYFQATPPYRLLKQQGTTFVGGPEVTTVLVRFYIAVKKPPVVAAPAVASAHVPLTAVFGDSPIVK
jgi:hypothetical protein